MRKMRAYMFVSLSMKGLNLSHNFMSCILSMNKKKVNDIEYKSYFVLLVSLIPLFGTY